MIITEFFCLGGDTSGTPVYFFGGGTDGGNDGCGCDGGGVDCGGGDCGGGGD